MQISDRPRRLADTRLVCLAAALAVSGCSISASSKSLSDSSGSSAKSSGASADSSAGSSKSSSGDEEGGEYRDQVRDFTASYVTSGGQLSAFQRTLGELAKRHGITDWEGDRTTFVGIGEGLAAAGVEGAALGAFEASLAGSDSIRRQAIEEGYATARR